ARASITKWRRDDRDLRAGFDRCRPPPCARQEVWAGHFNAPVERFAVGGFDSHVKPAVRVGPLELLYNTAQHDRLFVIEHGRRMVTVNAAGPGDSRKTCGSCDSFFQHCAPRHFSKILDFRPLRMSTISAP